MNIHCVRWYPAVIDIMKEAVPPNTDADAMYVFINCDGLVLICSAGESEADKIYSCATALLVNQLRSVVDRSLQSYAFFC